MFYRENKIDILAALLMAHGVRHVVACPGSRNAPIINSLCQQNGLTCHPVTDERSAGFYALGMALATGCPVAVCVTSGTALLNVAPAVAEAYYQRVPLVVLSADRPAEWIDQHVGQTIRQEGALASIVRRTVNLRGEVLSDWYCDRVVNEALLEAVRGRGPVHINVPLLNPSQYAMTPEPAAEGFRVIQGIDAVMNVGEVEREVAGPLLNARRPMLILGQERIDGQTEERLRSLSGRLVVISEPLSSSGARPFSRVMAMLGEHPELQPDFVVYMGGTTVCRVMNEQLARLADTMFWEVDPDGEVHDTYRLLRGVVKGTPQEMIGLLADCVEKEKTARENGLLLDNDGWKNFVKAWDERLSDEEERLETQEPPYSSAAVVKYFEEQLEDMFYDYEVHYANSTAVRLACRYARGHRVWCNRGANGIEGSLSTAAGFSVATDAVVFCVTGDLSFFYDQNALWNKNLRGNLRIILLNDGGGSIFGKVAGLSDCAGLDSLVSAAHDTDARGICTQNDIGYLKADDMDSMRMGVVTLMTADTRRPMLLEVNLGGMKKEQ